MGNEIGAAVTVEPGTNRYISVHDQRGSVAVLLNPAGSVAESYRYDAYGNVKIYDGLGNPVTPESGVGGSAIGNPWMFSSKRFDKETGLINFGRRFYDPTVGRFVTADPSGFADGPNLYAYCGGDPINLIDPDGQLSKSFSSGSSAPSWLSSTQNNLHNLQTYGSSFENSLRGTMAPGIAAASVFNPFNIAQGIANEYQANYNYSGSHYNALNLTFNPVVRGFLNASQATDGIGYNHNNSGMSLSTGQRIGSGVAAGFNALEAVGVGYGAAKLTTYVAPSLNRVSFSSGLPMSSGLSGSSISPRRIVLGEDMDRVRVAALRLGAETFEGKGMAANRAWVRQKRAQGYEVYDIGPAFVRRAERLKKGQRPDSIYYNMERTEMKGYENYFKQFERTGKYKGGAPGIDY